jgi:hypothetical protein
MAVFNHVEFDWHESVACPNIASHRSGCRRRKQHFSEDFTARLRLVYLEDAN